MTPMWVAGLIILGGLIAYNNTAALYDLPRLTPQEYDLLKEILL